MVRSLVILHDIHNCFIKLFLALPRIFDWYAGASTPDRAIEEVLDRVFQIRDPKFTGIAPKLELLASAVPDRPEEH